LYLLVVEGNSSRVFPLPSNASTTIGRATGTNDLVVDDPSVSRQHARIIVDDGTVRVADLSSHNGIRVNGEQIVSSHPLYGGDVLTLGNVTLVFHQGQSPARRQPCLEEGEFRQRLAQELDRIRSREDTLTLIALDLGHHDSSVARATIESSRLRLMDVAGKVGNTLMVMLPELGGEEAARLCSDLLKEVRMHAPDARAGLATAPRDGMEVEVLVAAARDTSRRSPPGTLTAVEPNAFKVQIGERSVFVADASTRAAYDILKKVADSDIPVLIQGETGVGKEDAARAVHFWSPRRDKPFQVLDCTALQDSLAESTLFGHRKGAFTGAIDSRAGLLEAAGGGTLFMDELGELPLSLQPKLLRALEQKEITRVGETQPRKVDLRIVAATNRNLEKEVEEGRFRPDLYRRIAGALMLLSPLRDRRLELSLLMRDFLHEACRELRMSPSELSAEAVDVLSAYPWPGNVRQLKVAMKYAATMARPGPLVDVVHLPQEVRRKDQAQPEPEVAVERHDDCVFRPIREELRELERQRMIEALQASNGNQTHAAQRIAMPVRTFMYKVKQYKIDVEQLRKP
jgi:two-component system, NtrC family, response regulator AtoC